MSPFQLNKVAMGVQRKLKNKTPERQPHTPASIAGKNPTGKIHWEVSPFKLHFGADGASGLSTQLGLITYGGRKQLIHCSAEAQQKLLVKQDSLQVEFLLGLSRRT